MRIIMGMVVCNPWRWNWIWICAPACPIWLDGCACCCVEFVVWNWWHARFFSCVGTFGSVVVVSSVNIFRIYYIFATVVVFIGSGMVLLARNWMFPVRSVLEIATVSCGESNVTRKWYGWIWYFSYYDFLSTWRVEFIELVVFPCQ